MINREIRKNTPSNNMDDKPLNPQREEKSTTREIKIILQYLNLSSSQPRSKSRL